MSFLVPRLRVEMRAIKCINMDEIETQFWALCDDARRHEALHYRALCNDSDSSEKIKREARLSEEAMVKLIALVEANPEHRSTFVQCFSELVFWQRPAPFLLVAFCMRRLRFPEIPELIERDAAEHKGTAYYASRMNFWSAINHAYLDEVWECANCFDFYREEK